MKILVTGAAGFIGFHTTARLLTEGHRVVGFDSLNEYYDPQLKNDRLVELKKSPNFLFIQGDCADKKVITELFAAHNFERVVHLAAQAGVRYSLTNPDVYIQSNLVGFANILEACRAQKTPHLVYASTSSVAGMNVKLPFTPHDGVDHPKSLYAATKRANELMAHTYSHLFGLPTTGLRFFTVYGPWGRPDMALFMFTQKILADESIEVFNEGKMSRDWTYVDDVVSGIMCVLNEVPQPNRAWDSVKADVATSSAPFRLFNLGNGSPVALMDFLSSLETALDKKANITFAPMHEADVTDTHADISDLRALGYDPKTSATDGIKKFVKWYRDYYQS